jgi:hypothetical protein
LAAAAAELNDMQFLFSSLLYYYSPSLFSSLLYYSFSLYSPLLLLLCLPAVAPFCFADDEIV